MKLRNGKCIASVAAENCARTCGVCDGAAGSPPPPAAPTACADSKPTSWCATKMSNGRCRFRLTAQKCAQTCDACGAVSQTAAPTTPTAATAACADLKRAICAKRKREGRLTCRRAAERRKCSESCGECRVS